MKKQLLLLFALFFLGNAYGQQAVQYSLQPWNPYYYNTAYAGLDESLSMTGQFRKQWTGFAGSPLSFNFSAHLPINYINSGVGFMVEQDYRGLDGNAYTNTNFRFSYNYFIDLGEGKLSIGAAFRYLQKRVDGGAFRAPDGSYNTDSGIFDHNDGIIPLGVSQAQSATADFGIYYKNERLQLGLSSNYLTEPILALNDQAVDHELRSRNYFLSGSYTFDLDGQGDWKLQPTVLLKTDLTKFQPELGVLAHYQDQFYGGINLRGYDSKSLDAVVLVMGWRLNKQLKMAYAYDLSVSGLRNFNGGSHEIMLNYNLQEPIGRELPAKVIYNPRFL